MKILDYAGLEAQIEKEKAKFAALQQAIESLDAKITNGLTTLNGVKQNKFNDVLTREDLSAAVTNVSEYVANLKLAGMKRSGIVFLEITFTSSYPVSWHTQNCFTLTAEAYKTAAGMRLQPILAYYSTGVEVLATMNPIVEKIDAGTKFQIGENNAPEGGEVRGLLIYPALNP